MKEFEREQFGWQKKKQDIVASHNQMLRKQNYFENQKALTQQMHEALQQR